MSGRLMRVCVNTFTALKKWCNWINCLEKWKGASKMVIWPDYPSKTRRVINKRHSWEECLSKWLARARFCQRTWKTWIFLVTGWATACCSGSEWNKDWGREVCTDDCRVRKTSMLNSWSVWCQSQVRTWGCRSSYASTSYLAPTQCHSLLSFRCDCNF